MQGKTVVITGGTSGIGEVAAVALAKMGARIVLVGEIGLAVTRPSGGFAAAHRVSHTPHTLLIYHD